MRRVTEEAGTAALAAYLDGDTSRDTIATATRYTVEELAHRLPGRSVELRVPPFAATQLMEGPRHTRGTPPAVIQTDPETWLALASGRLQWDDAVASGAVEASGARASLGAHLPLLALEE